jgi:hypothetical protein
MKKWILFFILTIAFQANTVFAGVDFNIGDAKATLGAKVMVEAGWDYQYHGDVPEYISDKETQQYFDIDDPSNVNLKAQYKNLESYIEIRFYNSNEAKIEMYSVYGAYNFSDKNSLLFGKAPIAFSTMAPKQNLYNANCLDGYGGLDPWKRSYQLRFSHKSDELSYDLALEEIKVDNAITDNAPGEGYQIENYFPAAALNLTYRPNDKFMLNPSVYIQQYKLKPKGEDAVNQNILTYAFSLGMELNVKPVNIQAEGWWGQNISALGGIDTRPAFFNPIMIDGEEVSLTPMGTPQWDGDKLKDVSTWGAWLQAEVPISSCTPRIGAGYQRSSTGIVEEGFERHIFTWGAFANCDIIINKYMTVTPELLYMFNGKDADKDFLGSGYSKLGYEAIGGVVMTLSF